MRSIIFLISLTLVMGLRPINIAVIAKTGRDGSDNGNYLKLNINGNWRWRRFPNLAGDDYMPSKSDWFEWSASDFEGFTDFDDLREIRISAGGNDGWDLKDISVFLQDGNNNWHVVVMHHNINRWIDRDTRGSEEHTIPMIPNFGRELRYIGCFEDDHNRDLDRYIGRSHTPESCSAICSDYPYFSIQDGDQCFCGHSYSTEARYSKRPNTECTKAGHGTGGAWRNSVYERVSVNTCFASGHITEVQFIAKTQGTEHAGSNSGAYLIIHTDDDQVTERRLPDLDGDDQLENKSDWWKWRWSVSYRTTQIKEIEIKSGGSDMWNPDKAMVVVKTTSNQYQVVAFDRTILAVDNDERRSLYLTPCPFQFTDTVGYWLYYASGDGGNNANHELTYSFTQSDSDSQSTTEAEEQFKSITHQTTVGVEGATEYKNMDLRGKLEYRIINTDSTTKRNAVTDSVTSTLSSTVIQKNTATPPQHLTGRYKLYLWNVFRKNNYNGGANLVTFKYTYKWGPCRDVPPNCVPGFCADDDCMTCTTSDAVIDPNYTDVRPECIPRSRCAVDEQNWHCCTPQNPCDLGQGDCDRDSDCRGNLVCVHDTHGIFDTCGHAPGRRSLKNVDHRRLIDNDYA